MLFTITVITILAYWIMGKDVSKLVEELKDFDFTGKINQLLDKVRPWALKAGRVATRPLLLFYYVMENDNLSTLDRILIYAAILYTISPMDALPRAIYKFIGVLDDGVAVVFVYNKIKSKITPEIEVKVDHVLNDWFGVEYTAING